MANYNRKEKNKISQWFVKKNFFSKRGLLCRFLCLCSSESFFQGLERSSIVSTRRACESTTRLRLDDGATASGWAHQQNSTSSYTKHLNSSRSVDSIQNRKEEEEALLNFLETSRMETQGHKVFCWNFFKR